MNGDAVTLRLFRHEMAASSWAAPAAARTPPAVPLATAASGLARPRVWYERRAAYIDVVTYERVKRLLDLIVCASLVPVVLPVIVLCMLAIRLGSPGPAFLVQDRTGKGGKRFRMFKLRTMVQNANQLKAQYMHLNEHTYPDFKITNDPRVTRCGRLLRKTSLDELPQIFNVIRGDMSLVGPRPTSFGADTYRLWHTARLDVPPGLTGLWQVSGRSDLDFDDRLRLDIAYVRHRCLSLDVEVMVRTIAAVLTTKGAH